MEDNTSISNFFLEKIEESIPFLTSDNASKVILNTLLVMLCIFWIYCGIKIYLDAVKRYEANKPLQLIFLILGV